MLEAKLYSSSNEGQGGIPVYYGINFYIEGIHTQIQIASIFCKTSTIYKVQNLFLSWLFLIKFLMGEKVLVKFQLFFLTLPSFIQMSDLRIDQL